MHHHLAAAALLGGIFSFWTAQPARAGSPEDAAAPTVDVAAQRAASIRIMKESIAIQRATVRGQASRPHRIVLSEPFASIVPVTPVTSLALPVEADCDPIPDKTVDPLIAAAASETKLEPSLLRAVIHQESAFRPCALSPRGAMGLMQLMPDTAAQLQVADPFDAGQNIHSGAQYLKQLLDRFKGDMSSALAAYNAGPTKVDQGIASGIPETQDYVTRILDEWKVGRQ